MPDDGGATYQFIPSADACDTCAGQAGEYDFPPAVPVHDNCRCQVVQKGLDCKDGSVRYEVRNLEVSEDSYTIEDVFIGDYTNRGEESLAATVAIKCEIEQESFDEGVEAELNWSPMCGSVSESVVFPARSTGEIRGEIEYQQIMCIGELWKICETPDPVAGFNSEECYVGEVGGIAVARTGLNGAYVVAEPLGE